jgi:hypothetical protein
MTAGGVRRRRAVISLEGHVVRVRSAAVIVAVVTAISSGGLGLATSAQASGPAIVALSWQVAKSVQSPNFPEFTAVTTASATSAWAFESASTKEAAYELTGGSWRSESFPGKTNESVLTAASSSSSNVLAISTNFGTSHSRILRFDGTSWSTLRTASHMLGAPLALSSTNDWFFGYASSAPTPALHYNGHSFKASAGSSGLYGASALSGTSIWAYGTTKVAHWNGHSWTSTSVKKQLPKSTEVCSSHLTGIDAISAKSVFAIGTGGCQDQLGPFVLLRYNGSSWSRIALDKSLGAPEAVSGDGDGGLWIPVATGSPASGSIEHYSDGKLSSAKLPFSPAHLALFDVAIGQHTTVAFAAGFSRKSFSSSTSTAEILRYGS